MACHWRFGNRKFLLTAWLILVFIWFADRIYFEVRRPSEEWVLFSTPKADLLQVRWGKNTLVFNPNFPPDQISFALDPHRIAQEVEPFPTSLKLQSDGEFFKVPGISVRYDAQNWRFEGIEVRKLGFKNSEQD